MNSMPSKNWTSKNSLSCNDVFFDSDTDITVKMRMSLKCAQILGPLPDQPFDVYVRRPIFA